MQMHAGKSQHSIMKLLISIIGLSAAVAASSALAQDTAPAPVPGSMPSAGMASAPSADAYPPGAPNTPEQQLKEVQKQLQRAQRELQAKFPRGGFGTGFGGGGGGGGGVMGGRYGIVTSLGGAPVNEPLIIRFTDADPKDQAALTEDLSIMSRILDKAVAGATGAEMHGPQALGVDLFMQPKGASFHEAYIEGHGAIFIVDVGFPLIAPPNKPDEPKTTGDSNWEEAKRELYGQPADPTAGAPAEKFSQEKVDKTKFAIYDALKNAKNIRALKPDELVTICVIGAPNGNVLYHETTARPPGAGANVLLQQRLVRTSSAAAAPRTYMTIQVKKSDATSEDIGKKVRLGNYLGAPEAGATDVLEAPGAQKN